MSHRAAELEQILYRPIQSSSGFVSACGPRPLDADPGGDPRWSICDDPAEKRENTIRLIWWEVPLSSIVQPTESQLDSLVEPYLVRQQLGLGFAIGYASPQLTPPGQLYFRGNIQNQFGGRLRLDGDALFEIVSISKTFTATLYALLIRSVSASKTVGDYIAPNGPFHISSTLAGVTGELSYFSTAGGAFLEWLEGRGCLGPALAAIVRESKVRTAAGPVLAGDRGCDRPELSSPLRHPDSYPLPY